MKHSKIKYFNFQTDCPIFRWMTDDDEYRYECFIPLEATKKAIQAGEGQKCKGALSYAYDFNVHCFVGHLRRVHAGNPPIEVEVTSSSGTKKKVTVKGADPLAKKGVLYYYHSKTKLYGPNILWGLVLLDLVSRPCSNLSKCPAHAQCYYSG